MATIHFFLQGKGGCGKSTSAKALAEYFLDQNISCMCIDTDPVNKSLAAYGRLNTIEIDVMSGSKIDSLKFDKIVELLAESEDEQQVIVDNGASSFIPFCDFLISNSVIELLQDMGHTVYVHTIVVGGDAQQETVSGFKTLAKGFGQKASLILWLNPFFGSIEQNGKRFEDFQIYHDNKNAVTAIVNYPVFDADTFGKNIASLAKDRKTLKEGIEGDYPLMTKQRYKIAQRNIYAVLDSALMGI